MKKPNFILQLLLLTLLVISCKTEPAFQVNIVGETKLNQPVKVQINNVNQSEVEQIKILLDDQEYKTLSYQNELILEDKNLKLGHHWLKFIFLNKGEELQTQVVSFDIFAPVKPKLLSYKLINTYPHDIEAFTQGLEFYKDTLYEGTGLNGESSLRKTDYKTGKVYKKIDLDRKYFGEGITVLNDKIYQLTWQNGVGFIYDTQLNKIGNFSYKKSKEGWGLCNDGTKIYKSDGSEKIWTLNPETLEEESFISVYTDKNRIKNINELEWVNGKIYTNVWQKNALAVIDPTTGIVEAIINLSDLHNKVTQHPKLDVLNGIAYDKKTGHLFVTGKKWDKMFEIEIIQK